MDLEIAASEDGLKMNWLLDKPNRVSSIQLHWAGADSLEIDATGNLLVHHALGTLTDLAPIAYQEIDDIKIPVDCDYRLYGEFDFGFELTGSYSMEDPIVIDPILQYATYLGGSGEDGGYGIAVDSQGHAYVTGYTNSPDFPVTPGAFQTTFGGEQDAFVTKFSTNGESLIYSTYLGGNDLDNGLSISLDSQNCAYITGLTRSTNFPVTPGAFQTTPGGIFVTKIATDGGSLIYSSFLGNNNNDVSYGIIVNAQGNAYITGQTNSNVLPSTPGAFRTTLPNAGENSGFITKFSTDGGSLIFSTYLGGNRSTNCQSIALDTQGYVYVTGSTLSTDFPITPGAFQTTFSGSYSTGFVTKLAIDGGSLVYSTYLGGSDFNQVQSITVDTLYCASVSGYTTAPDYPVTTGAFQTTRGPAEYQGYVTKLSPSGDALIGSTYLGGSTSFFDSTTCNDIKTDLQGRIYVTGNTLAPDFPTTPSIFPSVLKGNPNAFVSIFSSDLTSLLVSYYLGGSIGDSGNAIAIGPEGAIYTSGFTSSPDFPVTPGAYQTTLVGTEDAYVTKIAFAFYQQVSLNVIGLF